MKKMLFVYNPNAGKGLLKAKLSDVLDLFVKAGYELNVYPTQTYKDAYYKIVDMDDDFDMVVCSGGDGTLDEVVTGMMKREKKHRIPIGYIPTGTTNDFASSLHISRDIMEAADTTVHGEAFACDIGKFNKDIFVYVAAFGLFTDVPYQTDQKLKSALGHAAYVLEGVKRLASIPSYRIKVTNGDKVIEDEFMIGMITNSKSVAGFRNITGKEVRFDDGEFEVTLIKKPKNLVELNEIITSLLVESFDTKHMYTFKSRDLILESDEEIPWTLDGEFGGQHSRVHIENKRKALQIMVQKRDKED
ncbi:MAG: YegS/Rv2252/BmrU family lipid kinase [Faecalimonas sp.]|nr:YegS/Rv2252/BmrU family lipid kinase [Faecalimonas sp.]